MLWVLGNDNTFDDEEDNSELVEKERHIQAPRSSEEVRIAIKRIRIGVVVVNGCSKNRYIRIHTV